MISAGDVWTVYSVVNDQVTSLSPMVISMDTAAVVDPGARAAPTLLRAIYTKPQHQSCNNHIPNVKIANNPSLVVLHRTFTMY